ncbi:box C/D snoRNA protein 1 [Phlebotomus argentipes]|uniref:box C/D snoRNA protein 1 n=1 Tax=Phlebotomus argentipes TaxID=94469 RepID=UPI00289381A2|nr:box C/D snoRNA protein 1 [Phlebotomus argentipes]
MELLIDCPENSSKCDISRLGACEVCKNIEAKYTCPKCEVKTCSLACLKIHKKELECDGIRDKTRYIPLKKMTNMDYMSDYNFLEGCTRFVHGRKRLNDKKWSRDLPQHLQRLRMLTRQRKTILQFLGRNFTRRKLNSTFYDTKSRKIYWSVEWVFVNAENKRFIEKKCSEKESVGNLLKKYIDLQHPDATHSELEHYRSRGFGGIKVMLKSEGIKCCGNKVYELDLRKSLEENLQKKTIIEFPTLLVIFKELEAEYDIIETDEEEDTSPKEEPGEHSSKKEEEYSARTNFLFTDESLWDKLSDDEENKLEK